MNKEYKLPEVVYSLLAENNMSQNKLADKLDQTQKSVSEWLSGNTMPSIYSIMNLAKVFDVSLDYLVYGEEK